MNETTDAGLVAILHACVDRLAEGTDVLYLTFPSDVNPHMRGLPPGEFVSGGFLDGSTYRYSALRMLIALGNELAARGGSKPKRRPPI